MAKFHQSASFAVAEAAEIIGVSEDTLRTWHSRNPTEYMGVKQANRVWFSPLDMYFFSLVRDLTAFGVGVRVSMHTAARFADEANGSDGPIRDECLLVTTKEGVSTMTLAHFAEVRSLTKASLFIPMRAVWDGIMAKARETFARESS